MEEQSSDRSQGGGDTARKSMALSAFGCFLSEGSHIVLRCFHRKPEEQHTHFGALAFFLFCFGVGWGCFFFLYLETSPIPAALSEGMVPNPKKALVNSQRWGQRGFSTSLARVLLEMGVSLSGGPDPQNRFGFPFGFHLKPPGSSIFLLRPNLLFGEGLDPFPGLSNAWDL